MACDQLKFALGFRGPRLESREAAEDLSPGREPWDLKALTPSRIFGTPLSARAGEGNGERRVPEPTAYAVG